MNSMESFFLTSTFLAFCITSAFPALRFLGLKTQGWWVGGVGVCWFEENSLGPLLSPRGTSHSIVLSIAPGGGLENRLMLMFPCAGCGAALFFPCTSNELAIFWFHPQRYKSGYVKHMENLWGRKWIHDRDPLVTRPYPGYISNNICTRTDVWIWIRVWWA